MWYSGKVGEHGGNIQALSAPNGFLCGAPMWNPAPHTISPPPASMRCTPPPHVPTLADGGYEGTGSGVHTPIKPPPGNQVLDADNRTYNALLRGLRCLGERGFALLTGRWRTLQRITASPSKIGNIIQASLTLTHLEHQPTSKLAQITSYSISRRTNAASRRPQPDRTTTSVSRRCQPRRQWCEPPSPMAGNLGPGCGDAHTIPSTVAW